MNAQLELRGTATAPVLTGYAALFGDCYAVGDYKEKIQRDAFARSLSRM